MHDVGRSVLGVWPQAGPAVEYSSPGFVTAGWSSVSQVLAIRIGLDSTSSDATRVVYYQPQGWEIVTGPGSSITGD